MDLKLEEALDAPVDLSHRFEVSSDRLGRIDILSLSPVLFIGTLQRAEPGYLLDGRIEMEGALQCSRCLASVPFARKEAVSWVFLPAHKEPREEETELTGADLDVVYYSEAVGSLVSLDPLIEEELHLDLPSKPLCREDCRGLCASCGADWNEGPCGCKEPEEPRWEALKRLVPPRE